MMRQDWTDLDPLPPDAKSSRRTTMGAIFYGVTFTVALAASLGSCVAGAIGQTPIITKGESFICTPERVWDGDGPIWCREGPRVRLAGISTRELDGSCRRLHACPVANGTEARDHLVTLLGGELGRLPRGHVLVAGPQLHCKSAGPGLGVRTAATCRLAGKDLGERMIRDGFAAQWTPGRKRAAQ